MKHRTTAVAFVGFFLLETRHALVLEFFLLFKTL